MQKSITETYENYKYNYTSNALHNIQGYELYEIKIDKDILYLINDYNNIYLFDLNNLDNKPDIIKINFKDYLITENDILYMNKTNNYNGTIICKYNNNNPITIYHNDEFYVRDICVNNNKVYLFGDNTIIILHENGEQELRVKYNNDGIFSTYTYRHNPCFNTNNSLYITLYENICLTSNISKPKIDKHIYTNTNSIYGYYMTIDYYDHILISHNCRTQIKVYSPNLEEIGTINNKCTHYSNIVCYDKSLYYINSVGNLCKEEYILL